MMESSNEYQSNKISFDAIKIGLASPEKIREWSRRSSGLQRTGSVTAESTKKFAIKVLSATDAVLK